MLCTRCLKKQSKGKITDTDIRASKSLVNLSQKFPQLQTIELPKAVQVENVIILGITQKSFSVFQDDALILALEKDLRGIVRPVTLSSNYRVVLSSLFAPLEVLGVDKVFVPDGSQEFKVRLKGESKKPISNLDLLCRIATALLNHGVRAYLANDIDNVESAHDEHES